jgi:hypothetical protein
MTPVMFLLDIAAILVMTLLIYFPRHRRRDMIVAYITVNLGLLAVTLALGLADLSVGIGFGLFAVLSIIRLRSEELDQQEVAYYFAALALGLVGGVELSPDWLAPSLMGVILLALFVGDHPRLFRRYRTQVMTLDRAWTDERALTAYVEALLGARLHDLRIRKVDLVEATTVAEVRYELRPAHAPRSVAHVASAPMGGGSR